MLKFVIFFVVMVLSNEAIAVSQYLFEKYFLSKKFNQEDVKKFKIVLDKYWGRAILYIITVLFFILYAISELFTLLSEKIL